MTEREAGPAGAAAGERAGQDLLSDRSEVLLRQVHPEFFLDGQPTRQAFNPTAAHDHQLSVDRGSLTTPEESFVRHTKTAGLESVGVWGVIVGEVIDVQLGALSDERPDNPAHCLIDFRGLTRGQREGKSKILKRHAVARGCLYRP